MSTARILCFFNILASLAFVSLPIQASVISLSEIEKNTIVQNPDATYVYCYDIMKALSELSDLDAYNNSPLCALQKHVNYGYRFAEYDLVIDTLAYAENFLQRNKELDSIQAERLGRNLDQIIDQVVNGELTVSKEKDIAQTGIIAVPASLELFELTPASLLAKRTVVVLSPALVVSTTDIGSPPTGLLTIDGVILIANDRVLLTGQSNAVQNGLWLAQSGPWTRTTDFATGSMPDQAYVFITSGSANEGSSWLCTTPTAVIDTTPISFVLFAYSDFTLYGDVTGVPGATTVSFVGGQTAANVALATVAANDATNSNVPSTIIIRDASGNFAAEMMTATDAILSNSLTVTPFSTAGVVHNNTSGLLSTSLIVNADISGSAAIANSKLATLTTAGLVANPATTANSSNLANAIVTRDGLGNFSAGTITATLNGNAASATSSTTATTATNFSGSLIGDVTGMQGATTVTFVGGQSASNVAGATVITNAATSSNTANDLVKRSSSGGFSAGLISITDAVMTNSLTVTPFSATGILHNNTLGAISSSLIVNADISPTAAIANSKLATLTTAGLVANSATTATSLNTASAIVARDTSGNINATTFIGTLLGTATGNLPTAGGTMTGTLQLPAGSVSAPSLVFTSSTTTGLSASASNLSFSTSGTARMSITSGGTVVIKGFTAPGIVHNDGSGNLTSSLILDSDIATGAGIENSKLAQIVNPGLVANSATTATSLNLANAIVTRDSSGNFSINEVDAVNLVASGNIVLSTDPTTATAGALLKGSNTPFIHDYGTNNMFVGLNLGNFTMTGTGNNTMMGASTFTSNASGANNTGIGFAILPACTTGSANIAIGSGAGGTLSTGMGNIYINANAGSASESATTRIGTSQSQCFIAGVRGTTTGNPNGIAVLVDSAGQFGTISSTRRVKHDIKDMADASSDILNLRPVTFVYNADATNKKQYGLIAEEVSDVFPEIVVTDEYNQPETIQYHILPVLLLNEIKKQQTKINQMEQAMARLQAQIEQFVGRVKTLENRV